MTMTAIAEAFERAKYPTAEKQAYVLATQMFDLLKDEALCRQIFERAMADMSGKSLPGEDQRVTDAHYRRVQPRQPIEGEAGQRGAPSPSPQHDGAGQTERENYGLAARPVVPRPAAPSNLVPVIGHIRSKPNPPRGIGAIAAVQGIMAKAIIFRLTDGRDIMDAQFHELEKIERNGIKSARIYSREAIVARYLLNNVSYANPDPFAKVGDLFPPKTIELAVAEANKEKTDAA